MRTKLLVLLLCLWSTSFVHAQFFESDGLYYEITSSTNHEVSVKSADVKEQIIIPSKVEYNGEQYTVTRIDDYAFYGSFSSIAFSESLVSIGSMAFYGCYSLTSVDVPSENANFLSLDGVLFTKDGTVLILYPAGKETALYTVPAEVTVIGDYAFSSSSSLSSVILPEGLKSIGIYAFGGCVSLSSISLPKNLMNIGENAFDGCYALTSIDVAFDNPYFLSNDGILFTKDKTSLIRYPAGKQTSSYSVPESVTTICDGAFNSCSSLTSIILPDGLTTIGIGAFSACVLLSSIILPDGLTDINHFMFRECKSLVSIILPSNLNTIGDNVFEGCSSLSSVIFPKSLMMIGYDAFYNCSALSSIYSNAVTPPEISGFYTFDGVNKDIPVYVPQESLEAYKAAPGWSDFTNFQGVATSVNQSERPDGLSISDGKLHNAEGLFIEINDMNGRPVYRGTDATVSLTSGVYIVRCKSSVFKITL